MKKSPIKFTEAVKRRTEVRDRLAEILIREKKVTAFNRLSESEVVRAMYLRLSMPGPFTHDDIRIYRQNVGFLRHRLRDELLALGIAFHVIECMPEDIIYPWGEHETQPCRLIEPFASMAACLS